MPDWIKLNREQLIPTGACPPNKESTTQQAQGQKPLVEIKLSDSGDTVVLRTKARIDRKRGGFLGFGHELWRGMRWLFGVNVKKIEREEAEHGFDKGVDTLVEELACGLMTSRDFLDKLGAISKAEAKLQALNNKDSKGAPTYRELTQRFGDNLSLCLLALRRESPTLFVQVIERLKKMSGDLEKEIWLLDCAASIRNNHKSVITEDFNNRRAAFHTYKIQIDALVGELWPERSDVNPEKAMAQTDVGRHN